MLNKSSPSTQIRHQSPESSPQASLRLRTMTLLTNLCLGALLLLSVAAVARSDDDCVYTVYVRTGSIIKGGTDSIIGAKLYDAGGRGIWIRDLERWGGLMGPEHNYFERGNLDIFSGRGPCLGGPVCALNLTSDGSGPHHGWYCNYVEVTSAGVHAPCAQQLFTVEQWLATDTSPYRLYALRDSCSSAAAGVAKSEGRLQVVETASFSSSSAAAAAAAAASSM